VTVLEVDFSVEMLTTCQAKCKTCNEVFPSKTKLFAHIEEEGHAQPIPTSSKKAQKKGKNKR
jgi:DnaJ family protein A protein 5